jgi:hypothetical protein
LGVAEKNLRLQLARTTSGEIHPVLEEFRWGDRSYQICGGNPGPRISSESRWTKPTNGDLGHSELICLSAQLEAPSSELIAMSVKAELWWWTAAWMTLLALVAGIVVSVH